MQQSTGDVLIILPSHNAWVVGNETVVAIDFIGLDYKVRIKL